MIHDLYKMSQNDYLTHSFHLKDENEDYKCTINHLKNSGKIGITITNIDNNEIYKTSIEDMLDITNCSENILISFQQFFEMIKNSMENNDIIFRWKIKKKKFIFRIDYKIEYFTIKFKINIDKVSVEELTTEISLMGIQENQKFVNIKQCKGFVRVCYLKLNLEKGTAQRLWIPIFDKKRTQEQLKDTTGRVYIIVIDGIIFKIGYTDDKVGIKNLAGYGVGNGGGPSNRTCGIHYLIAEQLMLKKKVEFFVMWAQPTKAPIRGLFGKKQFRDISPGKPLEHFCLEDYKKKTGGLYPKWNKQEGGRKNDWTEELKKIRNSICNKKFIVPEKDKKQSIMMQLYYHKWSRNENVKGKNLIPRK